MLKRNKRGDLLSTELFTENSLGEETEIWIGNEFYIFRFLFFVLISVMKLLFILVFNILTQEFIQALTDFRLPEVKTQS